MVNLINTEFKTTVFKEHKGPKENVEQIKENEINRGEVKEKGGKKIVVLYLTEILSQHSNSVSMEIWRPLLAILGIRHTCMQKNHLKSCLVLF